MIYTYKLFKVFPQYFTGSSLEFVNKAQNIDLCVIEYSLGDALLWSMGMKRVSIFGIWRENCPLPLPTFHANCWLIKRNCWQNVLWQYDFWLSELHEKILTLLGKICLSSLFSKINWSYNRHNVSAAIWDQKFLSKSDLFCPDRLHLDVKMKVSSLSSTWCIRFWHTIYRHQTMTQILESAYY